jgi:hypothetical protein
MDSASIIKDFIIKLRHKYTKLKSLLHFCVLPAVSELRWDAKNYDKMIEKFSNYVLKISNPARGVQIAIHVMNKKEDLENYFYISPAYWLHFGFESQAKTGFERGARKILEDFGFHCSEWVGVEVSESQLAAFRFGEQDKPALILFLQNHGARRNCDFLIPVIDPIPQLAQANCL